MAAARGTTLAAAAGDGRRRAGFGACGGSWSWMRAEESALAAQRDGRRRRKTARRGDGLEDLGYIDFLWSNYQEYGAKCHHSIFTQARPHCMDYSQLIWHLEIFCYLFPFKRLPADLVGDGPNLNYRCYIFCWLFFVKIIIRFKSRDFIIVTPIFSQDSTPRYERSCWWFWPYFENTISHSNKIEKNVKPLHLH